MSEVKKEVMIEEAQKVVGVAAELANREFIRKVLGENKDGIWSALARDLLESGMTARDVAEMLCVFAYRAAIQQQIKLSAMPAAPAVSCKSS